MNAHTLDLLQFTKVAEIIARYAVTEEGCQAVLQKRPSIHGKKIEFEKKITGNFLQFLHEDDAPPIEVRPPLFDFFSELQTSGMRLDIDQIYAVGLLTESIRGLKLWHTHHCDTVCPLTDFIGALPSLETIHKKIFSFISKDGQLQKIASLTAIEKKITRLENESKKIMHSFFTDEKTRGLLQSDVPALRDGRQVLAVRANFKGRIKGIIHEYSQTGQTFYLEPDAAVQKNNELIFARAEYDRELHKLLRKLTNDIIDHYDVLSECWQRVIQLDSISAAALWAKKNNCSFALDSSDDVFFFLEQARHPLLGKNAVPIDLKLSAGIRMMIITGPNTGGKTVSLKTAALFAIMNQTGWPIPAGEHSRLAFFDYIACDIGDEQSLDESLSTFSAHMKTISEILDHAGSHSLVILDELGSGTDPQEGSAIGMAVLDELLQRQSTTFVSSHHGVLKHYAFTHPACMNASVEFNYHTSKPGYKILSDVPGESHAIDIAQLSGIPHRIVKQAQTYITGNHTDVSKLIQGLTEKYERLNIQEAEQKKSTQLLQEQQRKTDLKALQLRQKELELREQGYKRLSDLFDNQRKGLENLVRILQEGEITREKTLTVKKWIADFEFILVNEKKEIKNAQEEIHESTTVAAAVPHKPVQSLYEGMEVYVKTYKKSGTIIRQKKNNLWLVSIGGIKITARKSDLFLCEKKQSHKNSINVEFHKKNTPAPTFELRLLGMRLDEARKQLEQYIDNACIYNFKEFAIIHGKGNGVLQNMVHEYLRNLPFVLRFDFARPEHGGTGKTIVYIDG